MEHTQKKDLSYSSSSLHKEVKNVFYGKVISIDDELDMLRIKVRIFGIDDKISDDELPLCQPFLPKFIHILPKTGEGVKVLISDMDKPYRLRFWIGSTISQYERIFNENYNSSLTGTEFEKISPTKSISTIPNTEDIFPKKDDVALVGRDNTDIILKNKEVRLRAGKHEVSNIFKLNQKNPSYLRLKINGSGSKSFSVLGGDFIYLLSSNEINKVKANLTDSELEELAKKLSPLVKGNFLQEILEIYRNAILTHIHGYSNLKADESNYILKLKQLDISKMLSNGVFIN